MHDPAVIVVSPLHLAIEAAQRTIEQLAKGFLSEKALLLGGFSKFFQLVQYHGLGVFLLSASWDVTLREAVFLLIIYSIAAPPTQCRYPTGWPTHCGGSASP